eukprot:m.81682 g.81682  ORF g.81682 m.81682 type:complete len:209 (-) comp14577_c0_seq14:90-716(-)
MESTAFFRLQHGLPHEISSSESKSLPMGSKRPSPRLSLVVDPSLPLPLPAALAAEAARLPFADALRVSPAEPFDVPLSDLFEPPPDSGESQCTGEYCDGNRGALTLGHAGACILQVIPVSYPKDDMDRAHSVVESFLDVEDWPFGAEQFERHIDNTAAGQRHMLYRWYAVHVFQVTGHPNRIELPACVLYRVRRMWPNAARRPYIDSS